jgi:hypothetical protein
MKRMLMLFAAIFVFVAVDVCAQERPYSEGPVSVVTSVKVKPGQDDNYLAYLDGSYKPLMEEFKKAGIILSYAVYSADPHNPNEADMYLVVTYPNMASLDGLDEKTEPLMSKVTGKTRSQSNTAMADRGAMREILGSETIRELLLK